MNLQTICIFMLIGFIWGWSVSAFNNFWARRAFSEGAPQGKAVALFSIRQFINILAMFLVYKNVPALIGTALGLTAVKNYILLKTVFSLKGKGVS